MRFVQFVFKKKHIIRVNLIRPLISRITRITHHSVCVYLQMKAFGTAGSEGAAPTRNISVGCDDGAFRLPEEYEVEDVVKIRAIRAIRVQEKTHHTRIIYQTTKRSSLAAGKSNLTDEPSL